jgi:hypothetical protein
MARFVSSRRLSLSGAGNASRRPRANSLRCALLIALVAVGLPHAVWPPMGHHSRVASSMSPLPNVDPRVEWISDDLGCVLHKHAVPLQLGSPVQVLPTGPRDSPRRGISRDSPSGGRERACMPNQWQSLVDVCRLSNPHRNSAFVLCVEEELPFRGVIGNS